MAFAKNLEIGRGYTAAYHRIGSYTVDRKAGTTTVQIDSYKDADTRKGNEMEVADTRSAFIPAMPPVPCADVCAWIYEQIKALPDSQFADAADV